MKEQEAKIILKDAYKKIKQLISDERWVDAHRACIEILRFDPDNIKIIRQKNLIEKNVRKINIEAIKEDLKKLQPLWKEEKYEELLVSLKELEPYLNDYPPLKKIILQAQDGYKKQVETERKAYVRAELENIKTLIEAKKYQEAIRDAEKLRIQKYDEEEVRTWIQKIRDSWIDNELKKNELLLGGNKFEDILLLLHRIGRIDTSNPKIAKITAEIKKRYREYKLEQKRDFIFIGLEKTRTMLQMRKFSKAITAAREILDIDPANAEARKLLAIAEKKETRLINRELMENIKQARKELKIAYKNNKKDFIRF